MRAPVQRPDRERIVAKLDVLLGRLATTRRIRHVIIAAGSLDGSWQWARTAGYATDGRERFTSETPWFLASVTKLYIATVVLRLYEQELIDLDEPISSYLPPELSRGLHVLDGVDYTSQITPLHLLGHLSGLPDYLEERPRRERSLIESVLEEGDRSWSSVEACEFARAKLAPHFPPSDPTAKRPRIRYSDTNYQLLMVIAERVTGRTMAEIYRELVFGPLGLHHTWLPGDQPMKPTPAPAAVWMGDTRLDRPLAIESFRDLYSTASDVLRFGRALFQGDVFERDTTWRLMTQRYNRFGFPIGVAALRAPSWPIEYGLGMMRFELSRWLAGGRHIPGVIGHTGSSGSWLWFCPSLNLLVAGTVDQTEAATVPFRKVPTALAAASR